MKNKLLFLSVFLCQMSVFSQQGKMDDDIKKYTARIDSIVTSEKLKMNDEMNLVEKNFQSGNLSSEELKARKMTIAEKYEKIINDKVDAENAELQKITKETAVNSVFKKNSDTVKTTVVISNKQGGMAVSYTHLDVDKRQAKKLLVEFFRTQENEKFVKK